jgi:peptide/nickel transport system permease protein
MEARLDRPGAVPATPGPWRDALRGVLRNRAALVALAVLGLVVLLALAAPLYSRHVAGMGPNQNNVVGTVERGGKRVQVVDPGGKPIGPGWHRRYLLGADGNGREVAVRLLYGARNSLRIGIASALITIVVAVSLGLLGGYLRGPVDAVVRGIFDLLWSFPAMLLAIALGTALAVGGLDLGPLQLGPKSLWIPTLIIGVVYVPYLGRPVRAQALALRERPWVEAAQAQGVGPLRVITREIAPHVASTVAVLGTLAVANNILTEAGLSFLGAGVQSPDPSWGNMVAEGVERLSSAPFLALIPGLAIALTVLTLNVVGDALRDALDPRAGALTR